MTLNEDLLKSARRRGVEFAERWYARPDSGCDEATLAALLEFEFREAMMRAAHAATEDAKRKPAAEPTKAERPRPWVRAGESCDHKATACDTCEPGRFTREQAPQAIAHAAQHEHATIVDDSGKPRVDLWVPRSEPLPDGWHDGKVHGCCRGLAPECRNCPGDEIDSPLPSGWRWVHPQRLEAGQASVERTDGFVVLNGHGAQRCLVPLAVLRALLREPADTRIARAPTRAKAWLPEGPTP